MFCKNCGAEVKNGSKFCGKCGASVSDITQSSSTQPTAKKKNNAIITILIAIIVLSLLIGAVAIIRSIITGDTGNGNSYHDSSYRNSDSTSENEETPLEDIDEIPPGNKNVDFCFDDFSWDMSYEEAYDKLEEKNLGIVSENVDSEDENITYLSVWVNKWEDLQDIDARLEIRFYKEQMSEVLFHIFFEEEGGYSLDEIYDYMVDKYEDRFAGAVSDSMENGKQWVFYDSNNNAVGIVPLYSWDEEFGSGVAVQHVLIFDKN